MLMVGNSLKSYIAPALAIGYLAAYIPFHVTWELEHTEDTISCTGEKQMVLSDEVPAMSFRLYKVKNNPMTHT